jgi:hypothetical protein
MPDTVRVARSLAAHARDTGAETDEVDDDDQDDTDKSPL